MDPATRSHFYAAIERAVIIEDPFPHLTASNIFPAEFYEKILRNLPKLEQYEKYSANFKGDRYSFDVTPSTVRALGTESEFWIDFESWLNSSELLNEMFRKFGDRLKSCYSYREKLLKDAATPEGVTVSPQSFLCRDFSNFALAPHTDAGPKLVVGIFYFPKDDSLVEFGTSLYRAKDPSTRDFYKSIRFRRDKFDLVKTFENRPNSFAAFLKSDTSFHGVEERPYSNVGRDVLFWIPRIGKTATAETAFHVPASTFTPEPELVA